MSNSSFKLYDIHVEEASDRVRFLNEEINFINIMDIFENYVLLLVNVKTDDINQ